MDNEVWKMYPEFSFVEVSTIGRVRTLDRVASNGKGMRVVKGRILKQWRDRGGYMEVTFSVNNKKVNKKVHRMVAQTFIPNPNNLPQVNHKDCDRTKNNVDNLEWCDNSYNIRYREKHGKAIGRPVFAINLSTLAVLRFPSQHEASRSLGANVVNVNMVIKGKHKQTGGYWFTNADNNAVETVRTKFGDSMADRVEELMNELQPA